MAFPLYLGRPHNLHKAQAPCLAKPEAQNSKDRQRALILLKKFFVSIKTFDIFIITQNKNYSN
jgi:hypothetical protein